MGGAKGIEGAEKGCGSAAGFDGVGGGLDDGSEGVDDQVAIELGLVGAIGLDVGGNVGLGEPLQETEEVL